MTNLERIKSASVEEIAEQIHVDVSSCLHCPAFSTCTKTGKRIGYKALSEKDCKTLIIEWLNEEEEF